MGGDRQHPPLETVREPESRPRDDPPDGDVAKRSTRRGNGRNVMTSSLGMQLRACRNDLGISLRELARRLDVSPSLVSQIETDKIHPSVGTLYAMVNELGITFDDLFSVGRADAGDPTVTQARIAEAPSAAAQSGRVQRAGARQAIDLESGVRWEGLTTWNDGEVDFLFARYAPGGASTPDGRLVAHGGREFGIVLTGQLGVTVGADECLLEVGDSISFESRIPHRLHNDGTESATAIWMVLGRES